MPLTLTLHQAPRRRFVDTPSPLAEWQLVHREADKLYPELRTLWETIFQDVLSELDLTALREALERRDLSAVETLVQTAWESQGRGPARQFLPELVQQTVESTAEALRPALAETLDVAVSAVSYNVVVPETLLTIAHYTGQQIVAIGERTLMAVREVIRAGFQEGTPLTTQLQELRAIVGLTPRQAQALIRAAARLREESLSGRAVTRRLRLLREQAVQRRAEAIARTESIDAASRGQQALWELAARQGLLDETFRRFWIVTPDDRLCPICAAIPGLNPQGVGLDEPFQTPVGEKLHPTVHVRCRCAVSLRRIGLS